MYNTKETHDMETIVELYFDKELSDITFESDKLEEWKKINEELGLTNQLSLAKGTDSPVPFPYMNESMFRVYTTLCPEKVRLQQYNKTPIPLEVLQQIAFCKKENHFGHIEIWYDDKSPDPLAVGIRAKYYFYPHGEELKDKYGERVDGLTSRKECHKHPAWTKDCTAYTSEEARYLIAKWGDVKRSFKELKELAIERFVEKHSSKMKTDIETLQGRLNNIADGARLYMIGEISESKATSTSDW
jgi:hypothetical protein